jgi:Uma2 family endonuclease
MVTMTLLPRSRPLTRADLDAIPDDGHRYELVDGSLLVTPSPSRAHQLVSSRLHVWLVGAVGDALLVVAAPTDLVLAEDTVVQPDLLVVDRHGFEDSARPLRPVLAVEILSPSTRRIDLALKRSRYEAAAIPAYWVVDPDTPEIIAWQWRNGEYVEAARATFEETLRVSDLFDVELVPARLLD